MNKSKEHQEFQFPSYVLTRDCAGESPQFIQESFIINEPKLKIPFADLYCSLQITDFAEALVFAGKNFIHSSSSSEKLKIFINALHSYAAKHLVMLGPTSPKSGEYRIDPVTHMEQESKKMGVDPGAIGEEMDKFCSILSQKILQFERQPNSIHPADISVFALIEICRIHPFSNGNGRVARILMNCILIQYGKVKPITLTEESSYSNAIGSYIVEENKKPFMEIFRVALNEAQGREDSEKVMKIGNNIQIPCEGSNNSFIFQNQIPCLFDRTTGKGISFNHERVNDLVSRNVGYIRNFFIRYKQTYWPENTTIQQITPSSTTTPTLKHNSCLGNNRQTVWFNGVKGCYQTSIIQSESESSKKSFC